MHTSCTYIRRTHCLYDIRMQNCRFTSRTVDKSFSRVFIVYFLFSPLPSSSFGGSHILDCLRTMPEFIRRQIYKLKCSIKSSESPFRHCRSLASRLAKNILVNYVGWTIIPAGREKNCHPFRPVDKQRGWMTAAQRWHCIGLPVYNPLSPTDDWHLQLTMRTGVPAITAPMGDSEINSISSQPMTAIIINRGYHTHMMDTVRCPRGNCGAAEPLTLILLDIPFNWTF